MIEILNFLQETEILIKEIIQELSQESLKETKKDFRITKGSGLSAMEAPRGTLFTYFEIDKKGRILNCDIITPTAQFLNNIEADLETLLPKIIKFPAEKRKKKIRSLIRAYDPCISCAVH